MLDKKLQALPTNESDFTIVSTDTMLKLMHDYKRAESIVYIALVSHRKPGERSVQINASKICSETGYCKSSVYNALRKLRNDGFLEVEYQNFGPNTYIFPLKDFRTMEEGIACEA